jgi:hypothetical protein
MRTETKRGKGGRGWRRISASSLLEIQICSVPTRHLLREILLCHDLVSKSSLPPLHRCVGSKRCRLGPLGQGGSVHWSERIAGR